jgi:hypothetical protein
MLSRNVKIDRNQGGTMKNIILISAIIIFQLTTGIIAKENKNSEVPATLEKEKVVELLDVMGITPYPQKSDLDSMPFSTGLLKVTPLSSADINDDFSNIKDLQWLEKIAKTKKVILFGEYHFFQNIWHLMNRVLFALNTYDYFPLIVIEQQYSLSAFLEHYVSLENDEDAYKYYTEAIYDFVRMKEEFELLKHIRQWNKKHPEKRIHVATADIEHDSRSTLSVLLNPYFQSIDSSYYVDPDTVYNYLNLEEITKNLRKWLKVAKSQNKIGQYPFITPEYVENVIDNLESTGLASRYDIMYYRQKAIIRNLTDPKFLGDYFITGKAIIYGGAYHTATRFPYPDGGNFYCEGSYLTFDFPPTKGKTYSIYAWGYAYSLGEMADVDLDLCLHMGTYDRQLISKLQKAYKQGLITPEQYFLVDRKPNELYNLVLWHAYNNSHEPLLADEFFWDVILKKSNTLSKEKTTILRYIKDEFDKHDIVILVPRSPIIRFNLKKP